jgi:hypothetical protein
MLRKCLRGVWGLVLWFFGDDNSRPQSPRQYQVIELEKGVPIRGDEAAIATLRDHPGFVALMNRMKLKQAFLKAQLEQRHESLRDVDILVIGLAWSRLMEFEVNTAIGKLKANQSPVALVDVDEFEKVRSAIESVGSQDQN